MKDWRAIAQARGLGLSASELERIAPPLDALDEAFRPLARGLTFDVEPDVVFSTEEPAAGAGHAPEPEHTSGESR